MGDRKRRPEKSSDPPQVGAHDVTPERNGGTAEPLEGEGGCPLARC